MQNRAICLQSHFLVYHKKTAPTFFTCSEVLQVFGMRPPTNRMLKTVAISAMRSDHRLHDDRITLPYNKTYVLTIPHDVRRKTFILICQPENFRIMM
jgi:hypothetical protein